MGKNSTGIIQLDEDQLDELRERLRRELMGGYDKELTDLVYDAAVALTCPAPTEEGIKERYTQFARHLDTACERAFDNGRLFGV